MASGVAAAFGRLALERGHGLTPSTGGRSSCCRCFAACGRRPRRASCMTGPGARECSNLGRAWRPTHWRAFSGWSLTRPIWVGTRWSGSRRARARRRLLLSLRGVWRWLWQAVARAALRPSRTIWPEAQAGLQSGRSLANHGALFGPRHTARIRRCPPAIREHAGSISRLHRLAHEVTDQRSRAMGVEQKPTLLLGLCPRLIAIRPRMWTPHSSNVQCSMT